MSCNNVKAAKLNHITQMFLFFLFCFYTRLIWDLPPAKYVIGFLSLFSLYRISFNPGSNDRLKSLQIISSSDLKMGIIIFATFFTLGNFVLFIQNSGYAGSRFAGLSFHPNQMGQIAGILFIIFLYQIFEDKKRYLLWGLGLVVALLLLISAASRGAMLSTAITMLFLCKVKRINMTIPLLLVVVIGVTVYLYGEHSSIGADQLERLGSTNNTRAGAWQRSMGGIFQSPIWGNGLATQGAENLLIKAFDMGGALVGIPLFLTLFKLVDLLYHAYISKGSNKELYYAIILLIVVSSMLEGYLVEFYGISGILLIFALKGIFMNSVDEDISVSEGIKCQSVE